MIIDDFIAIVNKSRGFVRIVARVICWAVIYPNVTRFN